MHILRKWRTWFKVVKEKLMGESTWRWIESKKKTSWRLYYIWTKTTRQSLILFAPLWVMFCGSVVFLLTRLSSFNGKQMSGFRFFAVNSWPGCIREKACEWNNETSWRWSCLKCPKGSNMEKNQEIKTSSLISIVSIICLWFVPPPVHAFCEIFIYIFNIHSYIFFLLGHQLVVSTLSPTPWFLGMGKKSVGQNVHWIL